MCPQDDISGELSFGQFVDLFVHHAWFFQTPLTISELLAEPLLRYSECLATVAHYSRSVKM